MSPLSRRVRDWVVEAHGGSVLAASKAANISNSTLWQIYRGQTTTPRAGILIKLSKAIGCSIDVLLKGEKGGH
jgi:transcriptional regulator with XRE-family HTH domain